MASTARSSKSVAQLKREIKAGLPSSRARSTSSSSVASFASGAEYDAREKSLAVRSLDKIRFAPIDERREAKAAFFEAMRDQPSLVAERVSWLLDGNYGYGQMLLAKQILRTPRMNRAAGLTQMIGAFEWQCPENEARLAWKALSKAQQAKLDAEVSRVIKEAEAEEAA